MQIGFFVEYRGVAVFTGTEGCVLTVKWMVILTVHAFA